MTQCAATKPLLKTIRRCPRRATHGDWCWQHAASVGGWRLVPPTREGVRPILMTAELMEAMADLASRPDSRLDWQWGEPDEAGFYTPTFTRREPVG